LEDEPASFGVTPGPRRQNAVQARPIPPTFADRLYYETLTECSASMTATDNPPAPTILLVDDEQAVRSIVVKILRRANYNVLEAESGEAALRIADAHAGKIDLLLSDMYMPGLRGPEVAQALAPKRPGVRVLFMSGYADQDSRSGVPVDANFLNKPFSGKELAAAVEAVLKKPPPS
jgi:two-component system cell cycle sensor histidine kinase/response regulator CckA